MTRTRMPNRPARTHFRFATAAALLTVASALLLAAAWLLIPNLIGDQDGSGCAVVLAALTVWVSALIGIVPVALLQPRGLMPAVHGYFIGAAIRVVVCILATVLAVRSATVATAPQLDGALENQDAVEVTIHKAVLGLVAAHHRDVLHAAAQRHLLPC